MSESSGMNVAPRATAKDFRLKVSKMSTARDPIQSAKPFQSETNWQVVSTPLPAARACSRATHESLVSQNANVRFLRHIWLLLDEWSMRGYCHDTHMWPAKMEVLRSLKSGGCHTRRPTSVPPPCA